MSQHGTAPSAWLGAAHLASAFIAMTAVFGCESRDTTAAGKRSDGGSRVARSCKVLEPQAFRVCTEVLGSAEVTGTVKAVAYGLWDVCVEAFGGGLPDKNRSWNFRVSDGTDAVESD